MICYDVNPRVCTPWTRVHARLRWVWYFEIGGIYKIETHTATQLKCEACMMMKHTQQPNCKMRQVSCVYRASFASYTCIYQKMYNAIKKKNVQCYSTHQEKYYVYTELVLCHAHVYIEKRIPASQSEHEACFMCMRHVWCVSCFFFLGVLWIFPPVCMRLVSCDGIEAWCLCAVWWHPFNSAPPFFCFCLFISFVFLTCDEYIKKFLLHLQ